MNSNLLQINHLLIVLTLILSACSDSKMRLEDHSSSNLTGNTDVNLFGVGGYLSDEELQLSKDASYLITEAAESLEPRAFNYQKWPKTCTENVDPKCSAANSGKKVGLRDVRISGQVLIVDTSQLPWSSLANQKNIHSLRIEADTVILRSDLNLPNTKVEIVATKLIIEKDGRLNVTPSGPMDIQAVYGKDAEGQSLPQPIAYDGADGLSGTSISVSSVKLIVLGDKSIPRFIARGGAGQNAGAGLGQTAEEFQKAPLYEASRTAIGDNSMKFKDKGNAIIFSGRHISGRNVKYPRNDTGIETHSPIYSDPVGSEVWPSDGRDAVAGGYPGAGGVGGEVILNVGEADAFESIVDVGVGVDGRPDVKRFGTKGGLPNPAYKIRWRGGGRTSLSAVALDAPYLEEHFSKDGIVVEAPQHPKSNKSSGRFRLQTMSVPSVGFSKSYFELKIKRIRALYIARKFTETVQLINQTEALMDHSNGENLVVIRSQLARLTNSLLNQKDYFGRGLSDVPNYTFSFNSAVFEAQVSRAMRAYYLSRVFETNFEESKKRSDLVAETIKILDEKFKDGVVSLAQGYVRISSIENEVQQAQRNQESIEKELEVIRKQIEETAKRNVESRRRAAQLNRFLDVAASVCQVIPAGQPALGLAATLAKTALKGPEGQTFSAYVDYYKSMKGQIKNYDKSADINESKVQWSAFKDQFDYEHLRNKTLEEKGRYLSDLYEKLGPTIDKVNEAILPLDQPIFGTDEIQNEISKIQTEDPVFSPIFSDVVKKLQNLLERKAKIQKELLEVGILAEQIVLDLDSYVTFSAIASDAAFKINVDDGALVKFYSEIAQKSQEDLLRLYSELTSAYEYIVLEKVPVGFSILDLRQRMDEVLKTSPTDDDAVLRLSQFYVSNLDILKNKMQERLNRMDSLTATVSRGVNLVLTAPQLKALNKDGYVDIELNSRIYADVDNVRITKISMAENGFKFISNKTSKQPQQGNMGLRFELGKDGALIYQGKKYSFNYPLAQEGMFRWEQYFQFSGGSDNPVLWAVQRSDTTVGLFDAVSVGSEKLSRSNHAGLTTLRIRRLSTSVLYEFRKLNITINFEYSQSN